MLTDDDLTQELRAAFRADTDTLSYDGRRRPRRVPSPVIPLSAAALTVGAVAVAVGLSGHQAPPTASPAPSPTATATATATTTAGAQSSARMVTEELNLSGFTVRIRHRAGEQFSVRANFRDQLPPGLKVITLANGNKASVGKDPVSGDNGVFITAPIATNRHRVFAILSAADLSTIVDLVEGPPTPVPLTTD